MTVIEFLADFAQVILARAQPEGIAITVLYNEAVVREDDKVVGSVATATLTTDTGAVEIAVGFPLYAEMNEAYKPTVSDDEWAAIRKELVGA